MRGSMTWQAINIEEQLRAMFPHGHPSFIKEVLKDVELHSRKNRDYASGGDPLGNFDRVAGILSQYPNFPFATPAGVAAIYMLKQLDAVFWQLSQGHVLAENEAERWRDITIYTVIIRCILQGDQCD